MQITVPLTDEQKEGREPAKSGSHQSQDTEAKASVFGLRTDLVYFFPTKEYCLQEVYSIFCDTKVKVIMNTEKVRILHRKRHNQAPKRAGRLQAFHMG